MFRVKLIADGSLGAETAALRHCYCGSHNKGMLLYTQEDLESTVAKSHKYGYQLEVHAIGDEAAFAVLEAFKKANVGPSDRPVLTHCQVLGADLLESMAKLGVIANIQPQFVHTDSLWAEKRLPEDLLKYSYCWKTIIQKGIVAAGKMTIVTSYIL
jgi:predicted amidohydrolase YtcJ